MNHKNEENLSVECPPFKKKERYSKSKRKPRCHILLSNKGRDVLVVDSLGEWIMKKYYLQGVVDLFMSLFRFIVENLKGNPLKLALLHLFEWIEKKIHQLSPLFSFFSSFSTFRPHVF